ASSMEMTMREIQDMTLNVARGTAGIDAMFAERQQAFALWGRNSEAASRRLAALRVTAVPLQPIPDPGRIFRREDIFAPPHNFKLKIGPNSIEVGVGISNYYNRPILRGAAHYIDSGECSYRQEIYQSGVTDIWRGSIATRSEPSAPYVYTWRQENVL